MYLFKEKRVELSKTQKDFAKEIGLSESYLSKVFNRKKKCSKLVAYTITKKINSEKEIEDFFERV